jgi:hypothetical protein
MVVIGVVIFAAVQYDFALSSRTALYGMAAASQSSGRQRWPQARSRFESLCDPRLDRGASTLSAMARRLALACATLALLCLAAPSATLAANGGGGQSAPSA